jgi:hypothetical protein
MKTLWSMLMLMPVTLLGEVRAMPSLTKENLVGIWEAVPGGDAVGMASAVYRMDITKDSESYLVAMIGPAPYCRFLCRLVESTVGDGKVMLRFRTAAEAEPTRVYGDREYIIEGTGVGDSEGGAITGKLISRKNASYPETTQDIFFKKAPWTRDLQQLSKDAERAIENQRRKPKA